MTARSPEDHAHTLRTAFARIGRVRSTAEVLAALGAASAQG
jgi:isochorismate hydrolase